MKAIPPNIEPTSAPSSSLNAALGLFMPPGGTYGFVIRQVTNFSGDYLRFEYADGSLAFRVDQYGNMISGNGAYLGAYWGANSYSKLVTADGYISLNAGTQFSPEEGLRVQQSNQRVGIGTTAPDRRCEINDASGNCLRLTYNDSNGSAANYADALVSSGGNLRLTSTGGAIGLAGWGVATPATIFQPVCSLTSRLTTVADTAYFVYLGFVTEPVTIAYVRFVCSAAGTSTQTAGELGLFSTPAAPDATNKTLTKLAASTSVTDCTTTGTKVNTSSLAYSVSAGTHLWAGYRFNMAGTEPSPLGVFGDFGMGAVQTTASATTFGSGSSYSGSIVTETTGVALAPYLVATTF